MIGVAQNRTGRKHLGQVRDIAKEHGRRGQDEGQADREQEVGEQEGDQENGGPRKPHGRDESKRGQENRQGQEELDKREQDRRDGQRLPGEVHLPDEVCVSDHRLSGGHQGSGEEVPREQPGHEEVRVVLGLDPQDDLEREGVDDENQRRVQEGPDQAEEGVAELDLEVLEDEVLDEAPIPDDLAEHRGYSARQFGRRTCVRNLPAFQFMISATGCRVEPSAASLS